MKKLLERLLEKLLAKPLEKIDAHGEEAGTSAQPTEGGESPAPVVDTPSSPASSAYPLGLASCWDGANASRRMMNILSPKMDEAKFKQYVSWMRGKGCDTAHVILANGGDGECAGYAAWRDKDYGEMLSRYNALLREGFRIVPWIITDDSAALLKELFKDPAKCVEHCRAFFRDAAYVVLGLEMDEGGSAGQWAAVRNAVRRYYSGPIGVHHTSGNSFPMAPMADIILGQLNPSCTEAQVAAQIKAIRAKGKRAVGFEYARGPARALALAAIEAGAEGVGNWDGGSVPANQEPGTRNQEPGTRNQEPRTKNQEPGTRNQEPAPAPAGDDVAASLLSWSWGGFSGASAKAVAGARISSLRVTSSGLSYKWAAGGCEKLGAESATDYSHTLACLFCRIGGVWRGGKFDWISTSRTSRDLKNVRDCYGGWRPDAIEVADAYAFVIVSRDGKQRTNIIMEARK